MEELVSDEFGAGIAWVRMEAAPLSESYGLDITLVSDEGVLRRHLEGASCREVTEAGIVVVALALDGLELPPEESPRQAPTREPAPIPLEEEEDTEAPATTVRGRDLLDLSFVLGGGIDTSSLPHVGGGLLGGLVLSIGRFELEIQGVYLPRSEASSVANHLTAGGIFWLWAIGARACYEPLHTVFELSLCVGVEAGQVGARGTGIERPRQDLSTWVAPEVAFVAAWRPHRRFGLRFDITALVPVTRPTFIIDDVGEVHRTPPFTLRLALSAEVHFL